MGMDTAAGAGEASLRSNAQQSTRQSSQQSAQQSTRQSTQQCAQQSAQPSEQRKQHVLVIDSSYGSTVALVGGSARVQSDTRAHVEQLVPNIERVLEDASFTPSQITQVVVGTGPAPFTGLRAGIVAARAFAFAHGAALCGQDVLEPQAVWCVDDAAQRVAEAAIAGDAGEEAYHPDVMRHFALVVNDARRRQLYWRLYDITAAMQSVLRTQQTVLNMSALCAMQSGTSQALSPQLMDTLTQVLPQPLNDIDITAPADIPAAVQAIVQAHPEQPVTLHIIGEGVKRYMDQLEAVGKFCTRVVINEQSLWHTNPQLAAQYMWATAQIHNVQMQHAQTPSECTQCGVNSSTEPLYVRRPDVSVPNPLKHVLGSGAVQHHE